MSKTNQKITIMRDRAIRVLRENGIRFPNERRQVENVVAEIERFTGLKCSGDTQVFIEQFVARHEPEKRLPEPRLVSTKPYRYDRRMEMNLARCRGIRPISMSSKVRDYVDLERE